MQVTESCTALRRSRRAGPGVEGRALGSGVGLVIERRAWGPWGGRGVSNKRGFAAEACLITDFVFVFFLNLSSLPLMTYFTLHPLKSFYHHLNKHLVSTHLLKNCLKDTPLVRVPTENRWYIQMK